MLCPLCTVPAGFGHRLCKKKAPWNFFQDAFAFYGFTFYLLHPAMSSAELFLIPNNYRQVCCSNRLLKLKICPRLPLKDQPEEPSPTSAFHQSRLPRIELKSPSKPAAASTVRRMPITINVMPVFLKPDHTEIAVVCSSGITYSVGLFGL